MIVGWSCGGDDMNKEFFVRAKSLTPRNLKQWHSNYGEFIQSHKMVQGFIITKVVLDLGERDESCEGKINMQGVREK